MNAYNIKLSVGIFGLIVLLSACTIGRSSVDIERQYDLRKLEQYENIIPIAILGSGPAGYSAALYVGRLGFDGVNFVGNMVGGQLTRTGIVENWPGILEGTGPEIMEGLKEQAAKWGAAFAQDSIEEVDFNEWPFKLKTAEGDTVYALSVIVATGATPRTLNIPGEKEYFGRGVTTCAVCDAPFYKGEEVVVVGGGDSAAEEAMQLAPYAKHITILVRADKMRASAAMQKRLKDYPHISIRYNVQVLEVHGNDMQLTGITLFDNKNMTTELMPTSGLFLAIGHEPNTAFLKDEIDLDENGYIYLSDRTQQTSVKGVFAAGDVADKRYRQAGVSAGQGIAAALDASFFLNEIGFNDQHQEEIKKAYNMFKPAALSEYVVEEPTTLDAFNAAIKGPQPVIVDFYAEWCSSCMTMLPLFAAVAEDLHESITFLKVNADTGEEIMKANRVEAVPTMLLFKDGQLFKRYQQTMTKRELYDIAGALLPK